jgi:hypothetical protein
MHRRLLLASAHVMLGEWEQASVIVTDILDKTTLRNLTDLQTMTILVPLLRAQAIIAVRYPCSRVDTADVGNVHVWHAQWYRTYWSCFACMILQTQTGREFYGLDCLQRGRKLLESLSKYDQFELHLGESVDDT